MSELLINSGIGEVRASTIQDGKPFAVKLFRNTLKQSLGGLYWGQVKTIARDLDGAFLDLGKDMGEVFIPFRHARPIAPKGPDSPKAKNISHAVYEGQLIPVEVIREALPFDNKLAQVRARRDIFENQKPPSKPECLSPPPTPVERAILWAGNGADTILFDDMEVMSEGKASFPDLSESMEYCKDAATLFEHYGINDRLDEAQTGISPLPGGGSVRFEETSAIVAIDVNSGSGGKGQAPEKAKLQTNIEAAHKIADEIVFQNFGGLMVIDFIDLTREADRRTLMKVFDGSLRIAGCELEKTGLSKFMLMELRRKRTGPSLAYQLNKSPLETKALKLFRLGIKTGLTNEPGSLVLEATSPIIKWLKNNDGLLNQLKTKIGRDVLLKSGKTSQARISL